MKIIEFSKENVKQHKDNKVLIIADFRNVKYGNESNTVQSRLANKYDLNLYPVISYSPLVFRVLMKYYGDCDFWIIDKTLMNVFKMFLSESVVNA